MFFVRVCTRIEDAENRKFESGPGPCCGLKADASKQARTRLWEDWSGIYGTFFSKGYRGIVTLNRRQYHTLLAVL